jgi:hypothetical protein
MAECFALDTTSESFHPYEMEGLLCIYSNRTIFSADSFLEISLDTICTMISLPTLTWDSDSLVLAMGNALEARPALSASDARIRQAGAFHCRGVLENGALDRHWPKKARG